MKFGITPHEYKQAVKELKETAKKILQQIDYQDFAGDLSGGHVAMQWEFDIQWMQMWDKLCGVIVSKNKRKCVYKEKLNTIMDTYKPQGESKTFPHYVLKWNSKEVRSALTNIININTNE